MIITIVLVRGNPDSLWIKWQDQNLADSARAEAFLDYVYEDYFLSDADSALILFDELNHFAQERNLEGIRVEILKAVGYLYFRTGRYEEALATYEQGLVIAERIHDDLGAADILLRTGYIYHDNEDLIKALSYYQKSLKIYQRLEDKSGLSSIYNEFGNIYRTQGEFSKALDYYQKSITNHRLIGDEKGNAPMYSNIGDLYLMQGDEQKALEYFEKGLKLYQESDDLLGIATIYSGIGSVKQDEKKVEEALDYLNRSLAISEKINDQQGAITTLLSIGLIYLDEHRLTKALEFCRRSYQLAGQLGDIGNQRDACDCLYESYKHLNNIELALSFHEKMNILDDSMQVEETARQMQQIEFANKLLADSLDQVAKDMEVEMVHQAEIQKKTMNRNLALVFGFFFLLLSIGLYRRWLYMKQSKAIIEKEKERSEALLLNILPSEIADELKAKGTAEARDHEVVSILFTDFKGFTEKAARLSAADLIAEINHCFKAFDLICEEFGIEKIKTIGDAYMAAGGLPVSNADSVANTIKAGLKMQDFIKNRITEKDENGIAFEMRVGIHTGPVVAGIVGVKKFQYDVWGDTVNTAARMESRGEPGKVNISQDTYYLVKNHADFNFTPRGMMEVKGKGKMWMWFVTEAISPTEPI